MPRGGGGGGGAKHPLKCQLHTIHVGAGGCDPQGSSPTACAEKVDQPEADFFLHKGFWFCFFCHAAVLSTSLS